MIEIKVWDQNELEHESNQNRNLWLIVEVFELEFKKQEKIQ
jgi:hypothetical protein